MAAPSPPSGGRRVDLHAHTIFSDGTLTPEALVSHAIDRGLTALAITDHDSMEGVPRALLAAGEAIEIVPGVEISTLLDGSDLHILGFYVDPEHGALAERLSGFRGERLRRALRMVERLGELGVAVDADEMVARAGPGVIGRPHVADALLRAGHVTSFDDAFRRYLGAQGLAFVPRPAFHPEEAIALIRDAGGVSVIAHPGTALPAYVIERLAAAGLRGIEVWHPQHGLTTSRRYHALAQRLGMVETGGSDYHGPQRSLDLGDIVVPYEVIAPLRAAARLPV